MIQSNQQSCSSLTTGAERSRSHWTTSASRTAAHMMRREVTGIPPRNRHPVPSAGRDCTRAVRAAQVATETSSGATSLTTARTSLATDCLATRPLAVGSSLKNKSFNYKKLSKTYFSGSIFHLI